MIKPRCIFYFNCSKINLNKETTLLEFLSENIYTNSKEKTLDNETLNELEHSSRVFIVIDDAMNINCESADAGLRVSVSGNEYHRLSTHSSTLSSIKFKQDNLTNTGHNYLSKIINREIMPKSKKIVTYLLNASMSSFLGYSNFRYENILLEGLNHDSQLEIIKSIGEKNEENIEKYLQNHPGLLEFCCMPDICFLTGHCLNELLISSTSQTFSPNNLTDIFVYLLGKLVSDTSLFDFNLLTGICDLAWQGIKNNKIEFDLSNLSEMSLNLNSQSLKNLSANINEATLFLFEFSSPNTFHFTISLLQEFFAAIYLIFMMPFDEFKMLISDKSKQQIFDLYNYQNKHIARFMFGLRIDVTLKYLHKINSLFSHSIAKMSLLYNIVCKASSPIKILDNTFLQHLAWVHALHYHSYAQNLASRLSNEIEVYCEFCQGDVSAFFHVLQARNEPVTITALRHDNFIDDSWKLFITLARSASIKMLSLDLSGNEFGNKGAVILSQCLNNVKQLILRYCNITAPGVEAISNKIRELGEPMLSLDLSFNKFRNKGAVILSQCLNNVKQLILRYCSITAPGVEAISNKIRDLDEPMLSLDLSGNEFGNKGATILSQCLNNVKQLILRFCNITAPGVEAISNKIRELDEPMLSLDLSGNKFGNEGAAILSQCLNNVKQLILQGCNITAPGVEAISNKIRELDEPMLSLDLSWNEFGNKGAVILSQCLNNVKQLILEHSYITAPGVEAISNKIRDLDEPMLSLDLSGNEFGNKGAVILSQCLNNVKQLILRYCSITAPGVEAISNKIRDLDEPIEHLNLRGNKVGNRGFIAISSYLGNIVELAIGSYDDSELTMEGIKNILSAAENTTNPLLKLKIYCGYSMEEEAKREAQKYQSNIWINETQVSFKVENVKNSEENLSEHEKQVESVQKHLINEAGRLSDIDPPQYLYETIHNIDIQLCENLDNLQSTSAQSCETVNLSHLFCSAYNEITQQGSRKIPEESQLFVAVVGSTGSGKTTIKKTLLNKYHTDKCLYGFDFVFCIRCSYTNLKHESNLLEFLVKNLPQRWLKNNQICLQVFKKIEKNHKLCMIFDDFNFSDMSFLNKCSDDEVNEQVMSAANFIRNIMSGKLLSNAFKFVCFRPFEFSQYMKLSTDLRLSPKIVSIFGVNQNNQDKILHSICGDNFHKVKTYLESYPDLQSFCYVFANHLAVVKSITGHVERINENFDPLLCIPLTSVVVSSFVMIIWNCVLQHDTIDLSEVVNSAWKQFSKKQNSLDQVNLSHDHNDIIDVFLQICGAEKDSSNYYLTFPSIVTDCFIAIYLLYFHESFHFVITCLLDRKSFSDNIVTFVFGLCNRSVSVYLEKLFSSSLILSDKLSALKNSVLDGLNILEQNNEQFVSNTLFLCCLVFEMHDIEFAGRVADCLPNSIDISNGISTNEVAGLSFVLLERKTEINIVFSTRSILNCIKSFEHAQKIITERNSLVRFIDLK